MTELDSVREIFIGREIMLKMVANTTENDGDGMVPGGHVLDERRMLEVIKQMQRIHKIMKVWVCS